MTLVALYSTEAGYNTALTLSNTQCLGVGYIFGMELFTRKGLFPEARISADYYSSIIAEVYEIPEGRLRTLDWDEGYPEKQDRKIARILINNAILDVYVYYTVDNTSTYAAIPDGDWAAYKSSSDIPF